jgi:hypothetical protein
MKKISQQSITGQLGANLIERIVLQMGYIWRPTFIFDAGVDGQIEIRDPVTGEVTNTTIKVQAKATTQPFQAETPISFEYRCDEKDLNYWLHGNAPIILIVCRPKNDEAYWIPVKEYFREPALQKSHVIQFDKQRDRFDLPCANALKQLALPKDAGIYFAPLPKAEKLFTNLLAVSVFAPKIFIADTDYRKPEQLWAKFRSMGVRPGSEWLLTDKRILSFRNLEDYPFSAICDLGTCESFDSTEWANANDKDKEVEFARLLRLALSERTHLLGLRFDKEQECYYFLPTSGLTPRRLKYKSIQRQVTREVFKKYGKKSDPKQRAYCRHSAFKGYFVRLKGEWFLEITPTYHFTSDGYHQDLFRAEHLKGIKRLERNPAVVGQLLMWVDYLKRSVHDLYKPEYPFLKFGDLATVEVTVSLPDEIWYQAEEGIEKRTLGIPDNQLSLFGL